MTRIIKHVDVTYVIEPVYLSTSLKVIFLVNKSLNDVIGMSHTTTYEEEDGYVLLYPIYYGDISGVPDYSDINLDNVVKPLYLGNVTRSEILEYTKTLQQGNYPHMASDYKISYEVIL